MPIEIKNARNEIFCLARFMTSNHKELSFVSVEVEDEDSSIKDKIESCTLLLQRFD
jgi:hypothetical protein